jgi:hypothetical protein
MEFVVFCSGSVAGQFHVYLQELVYLNWGAWGREFRSGDNRALEQGCKSPHLNNLTSVPPRHFWGSHENNLTSPQKYRGCFKTTSPHLEKIEVVSKQPHLTSKKSRLFWNNLTSPQKNRGDFQTTSPHLGKIEVVLKQPHLTSRWYSVTKVIPNGINIPRSRKMEMRSPGLERS